MTPREVLTLARDRGLHLEANGDKLRVIPAEALTEDIRSLLLATKPALLQLLAGPRIEDGAPAEHCRSCGSPNWWTSHARPGWHCSYCDPRPEPFMQGRIAVIASGEWARH